MRRGEFEQAWQVSNAVLKQHAGIPCWHLPRHEQYVWDGSPLQGRRVLVRCYHGLGDTIMMLRYLPLVKRLACEVTLWAQPALVPLLRSARGIDRLLPLHDGTAQCEYDVDVESMELPFIFRTSLETIPRDIPYLRVETAPLERDHRLQVGLVWSAGDWQREYRSISFELVEPLADAPGVAIHILQRGPALDECPLHFGFHSGTDDILQVAQRMRALDLVISVDSMPAHLAGALGVPVWTLLAHQADWRWMNTREDSPWYPTMRLFRQPRPADWKSVIARVSDELRQLTQT